MEAELTLPELPPTGATPPPNPFVGPRSFARGETLFGRDREAEEIVDLLIAERIVLLYSPSGAGKTSLIQAKLIPMLASEGFTVRPIIRVAQAPSDQEEAAGFTNRYLFSTLRSLSGEAPAARLSPHVLAASTLDDFLTLTAPKKAKGEGELIIFDQFEEVLNIDRNAIAAKEEFFDQLGEALRDKTRWALIAMREDFIAALDPYLRLIPRRLATRFRLDLLGVDAAHHAICGPAETRGIQIDSVVVSRLLDDLRRVRIQGADGSLVEQFGPVVEPVQLQVVCYRSWSDLVRLGTDPKLGSDSSLHAEDLAIGSVDEALAGYYADKVAAVAVAVGVPERTIREWCQTQLITASGFRGQVLREVSATQGLDDKAILALIDAHLVRSDDRHGVTWYELAHDRLIEPVKISNDQWRERHLNPAQIFAAAWALAGSPPASLPSGKAMKSALDWGRQCPPGSLLPVEANYLAALNAKAVEEKKRAIRRIASFVIPLVICATTIFLSIQNYINKKDQDFLNFRAYADEKAKIKAEEAKKDKEETIINISSKVREAAFHDVNEAFAKVANQNSIQAADAIKAAAVNNSDPTSYTDPMSYVVPMAGGGGSIDFRFADDTGLVRPPIPVRFNGQPVQKTTFPRLGLFNTVDIFASVGDHHSPLIWSDRVSNLHLRATYPKAGASGAALGTEVIATPSFFPERWPHFMSVPDIQSVDLNQIDADRLQSTTHATFGPFADVTSVRTFLKPSEGRTKTLVSIDFLVRQDISLQSQPDKPGPFRLLSLASMFSDAEHYNADLIRIEDPDRSVRTIDLRTRTQRGLPLIHDARKKTATAPLGHWFELVKRSGSLWFPDGPTIRVEILAVRGLEGRLGIQGWLETTKTPSHDSLKVWVVWLDAPQTIPTGTALGVDIAVIALAPEPADSVPAAPSAGTSGSAP